MKNSGVYKITNTQNGKFYIGSSLDINSRKNAHFRLLRKNAHNNIYLQNAFNKYGEAVFQFEILEYCLVGEEREKEQIYLDRYKPYDRTIGYNISKSAFGGGIEDSELHYNSRLTWENVKKIRFFAHNGETLTSLSKKYNVTIQNIRRIVLNEIWYDENYNPLSKVLLRQNMGKNHNGIKREIVRKIRLEYCNGEKPSEIRAKYNIGKATFNNCTSYRAYPNSDKDLKELCIQRSLKNAKHSPRAKFSQSEIKDIFSLRESGMSFMKIAEKKKCSKKAIMNIIKEKTYKTYKGGKDEQNQEQ